MAIARATLQGEDNPLQPSIQTQMRWGKPRQGFTTSPCNPVHLFTDWDLWSLLSEKGWPRQLKG